MPWSCCHGRQKISKVGAGLFFCVDPIVLSFAFAGLLSLSNVCHFVISLNHCQGTGTKTCQQKSALLQRLFRFWTFTVCLPIGTVLSAGGAHGGLC